MRKRAFFPAAAFSFFFLAAPLLYADLAKAHEAMAQNRYAEAAAEYHDLIRVEKQNMEAYAGLASALFALARYDEIVTLFPEEIKKGNIDLNRRGPAAMAILKNIGFACYRSGQSKKAIVALSVALKVQDDDPEVYNALGLAYLNTGSTRLAEIAFQTAVNLAPASPLYINNLGTACLEQKRYRDALISFEKSVRLDRGYYNGWTNVWLCREKLGLPSNRGEYWFSYFLTATDQERLAHQNYLDAEHRKQELAAVAEKTRQQEEAERLRLAEEARITSLAEQSTNQSPSGADTTNTVIPPDTENPGEDDATLPASGTDNTPTPETYTPADEEG